MAQFNKNAGSDIQNTKKSCGPVIIEGAMPSTAISTISKRKRSYSEAEKMGALVIAVREGVAIAVERTGVPRTTLYHWLEDAGGLEQIRTFANLRAEVALSEAVVAVSNEYARRTPKLRDEEIGATIRKIIDVHGQLRIAELKSDAASGAKATASTRTIVVNIPEDRRNVRPAQSGPASGGAP